MPSADGKRVLIVIAGGIAAYKALEVIRLLAKAGVATRAVLTESARQFVTPLSVGALTGDTVYDELFDLTAEAEMGHIELSRSADLILVVPATANLVARMAHGLSDDLASTVLLATDTPVVVAPAMNVRMWLHPATRRNIEQLKSDGIEVIEPDAGEMACGEFGPGRLPDPEAIVARVLKRLAAPAEPAAGSALAGRHVVITSGPTHEPIDPVRYIANRSSGKQGHAIAAAARRAGARVTLISGPVTLPPPAGVEVVPVESAREMLAAAEKALPADVAIFAAAVADWRVESAAGDKLKKTAGGAPPALALVENPDILRTIAARTPADGRPPLVIGFAAETRDVIAYASEKRLRKGCDWIVANDVSMASGVAGGVMGGARNQVHLITGDGVDSWPELSKDEVADRLIARIAAALETSA